MKKLLLPIISLPLLLAGCASSGAYQWGNYESGLYGYYKSPNSQTAFTTNLAEDLATAETAGKVPPGLFAEYGFLMLKAGKNEEARRYFLKEQQKWPEARTFMETLLKDTTSKGQGN